MSGSTVLREYRYRAKSAKGSIEEGTIRSRTRQEATTELARRGLLAFFVKERRTAGLQFSHQRVMPLNDASAGLRSLGELLTAGLPLERALIALPELAPPAWLSLQTTLIQEVRDGARLSDALARSHVSLPAGVIGIIAAGEQSGRAGPAVIHAATVLESEAERRTALVSAVAYPALLTIVGTVTVSLLLMFVFPRMARLLADMGQDVPPTTRLLLAVGNSAPTWLGVLGLLVISGVFTIRVSISTEQGRQRFHSLLLRIPVFGELRHRLASARICAMMGATLAEGLPLTRVLAALDSVISDAELKRRLAQCRESIGRGEGLASALKTARLVTSPAVLLVAAGERAGNLPAMLANAGAMEAKRAERTIRIVVKFIEPALILLLGLAIMFVAGALLQTVYSIQPTA